MNQFTSVSQSKKQLLDGQKNQHFPAFPEHFPADSQHFDHAVSCCMCFTAACKLRTLTWGLWLIQ
jgi:hypothetical protein